jgi:hypothetical protein
MTPSVPSFDPAAPDLLAGAALRALTREHPVPRAWGAAKTTFLGALTFGVLPLYAWPKTFRTAATMEHQQLRHMAEWLRLRSGHPDAERLTLLADRVGFRPILWACSMLCLAVTAAVFSYQAARFGGFNFLDLRASTYNLGRLTPPHLSPEVAKQLFTTWTVGLCCAYTLHWFHLQLHNANVRRFVDAFNAISDREQIRPVIVPPMGLGVRPIWAVGAIALVSVGAVWAIPMTLAGAIQSRWPKQSRVVRTGLSDALRQMLLLRRPAMRVPRPPKLGDFCANDLCRARVPPQSRYCPRCGQPVMAVAETANVA